MDRRFEVVVTVLLVMTAGCSALSAVDSPTSPAPETLTPVPVETGSPSATATPTPAFTYPPGVFRNGTIDPDRLFRAHAGSFEDRSYTWVYRRTEQSNRTGTVVGTTRTAVDGRVGLVENRGFRSSMNNSLFLTRQRGYLRWTTGDETEYAVRDATIADRKHSFVEYSLRTFLPEQGVTANVVQWNGRRYVRLYVEPRPPPEGLTEELVDSNLVWGFTLTAYISPAGRVRMMAVEYNDLRAHVSWRFDYRAVGETTVHEPDWVSTARRDANRSG